jgi:hypothetical protein
MADMVRRFAGAVNAAIAQAGSGTGESANLVKAFAAAKNDLKSFHAGPAALLDKRRCG